MFKQRTKYAIPLILIVLITTLVIPVGPVGDTDVAQAATDPDLLIIAPMEFSAALQLLVDHKNSTGMPEPWHTRSFADRSNPLCPAWPPPASVLFQPSSSSPLSSFSSL